ncbi:hypothetical protein HDV01_002632 [Terramyces sp. JEL0728]|nr:hypothetical protein HDV01_002632 [Terramyces sp. JEL0728]
MKYGVILSTVRAGRMSDRVGKLVVDAVKSRGHSAALIDPKAYDLPMLLGRFAYLDKSEPSYGKLSEISTTLQSCDAFIVCSAEYNFTIPPALTNLMDYFLDEYKYKPSAICCYSQGSFGGIRAGSVLRSFLDGLGCPSIPKMFPIPTVQKAVNEDGTTDSEILQKSLAGFLSELEWYAEALSLQRAKAFFIYRKAMREKFISLAGTSRSHNVSKVAGESWAKESPEVKAHYQNLALVAHQEHKEKYPDFEWCPKKPRDSESKVEPSMKRRYSEPAISTKRPYTFRKTKSEESLKFNPVNEMPEYNTGFEPVSADVYFSTLLESDLAITSADLNAYPSYEYHDYGAVIENSPFSFVKTNYQTVPVKAEMETDPFDALFAQLTMDSSFTGSRENVLADTPVFSPILEKSIVGVLEYQEKLKEIDADISLDPTNLIKHLSDINFLIEKACLSAPEQCGDIWKNLKGVLTDFTEKCFKVDKTLQIPRCKAISNKFVNPHGEEWEDNFSWLNDRNDPGVLKYIDEENVYANAVMEDTKSLQKLLYKEFVSRLDQDEESPKLKLDDETGEEFIYLNENDLATKQYADASFFSVGYLKLSPDCSKLAYGVDGSGQERYSILFKDLKNDQEIQDQIEGAYIDLEFSEDGNYVFYTLLDDTERAYQIKRHKIGTPATDDVILYEETDEMFFLTLKKTCDRKYLILTSAAQITSEIRYLNTATPEHKLELLLPRQEGIQYLCVEHHDGYFYILSNAEVKNNYLYRTPVPVDNTCDINSQEIVVEHRDFVLIEDFQFRKNYLIVLERSNCLQNVRILNTHSFIDSEFTNFHYVSFSENVYSLWLGTPNEDSIYLTKSGQYNSNILRITYTSFIQPKQVIDYNMNDRSMTIIHEEVVNGVFPYDKSQYHSQRLYATSYDGTSVPVSIVYRKDLLGMNMNPIQYNPCLLHAYGAYGSCVNPIFSASRLSLLDRGFIYAVAHTRGGADMGNGWYEEGKLAKKPNTFYDFCAVAEYLIKEQYTVPSKLAIYGRSAGGLLIGASINMRPDLFQSALTEVPFVDVINTMFDSSIPWTAFEYEEWGNPNDEEIYEVMKGYCPYTNIDGDKLAQNLYPNLLVLGGMNDPRVAFFEPLKLVAKMRYEKQKHIEKAHIIGTEVDGNTLENRMLILKIDNAGHGGNSGQYSFLEDLAFEYAFLIKTLNALEKPIYSDYELFEEKASNLTSSQLETAKNFERSHRGLRERLSFKWDKKKENHEEKIYRNKAKKTTRTQLFQWLNNFL